MSAADWAGIVVAIATVYFLWQANQLSKEQNQIFREQNKIIAKQEGGEVATFAASPRPITGFKRYWPMASMAMLALLTWTAVGYDIYDRHHASAEKKETQVEPIQSPSQQHTALPPSKPVATPPRQVASAPVPEPSQSRQTAEPSVGIADYPAPPSDDEDTGNFSVKREILSATISLHQISEPRPTLPALYPWSYRFTISLKINQATPYSLLQVTFDAYGAGDRVRGQLGEPLRIFDDLFLAANSIIVATPESFSKDRPLILLVDSANPVKITAIAPVR